MMFLIVKWLHILSATVLFGTGIGIAFFMWRGWRSNNAKVIAHVTRSVVIADGCFTAPAVVIQAVTGWWLTRFLKIPLSTPWLGDSIIMFLIVGACWLPVVWLQMRVCRLARGAAAMGVSLPAECSRAMCWWFWLGWPALFCMLGIFFMMVARPG